VNEEHPTHGAVRIERHPLLEYELPPSLVTFTFDGLPIEALEGEPIAVALLAAGIRVFRTMPRTGDARGGYCMVGRCPDCAVVVDGVPNVRSCVTPVMAGLQVHSQHGLGDLESAL
jgi:predicted molibdopterin-dependent oxidoreductase YjgC